jgi:hypothetical protein
LPICYELPDGEHVRGCETHQGKHPFDWCRDRQLERQERVLELRRELERLTITDVGDYAPDLWYSRPKKAEVTDITVPVPDSWPATPGHSGPRALTIPAPPKDGGRYLLQWVPVD